MSISATENDDDFGRTTNLFKVTFLTRTDVYIVTKTFSDVLDVLRKNCILTEPKSIELLNKYNDTIVISGTISAEPYAKKLAMIERLIGAMNDDDKALCGIRNDDDVISKVSHIITALEDEVKTRLGAIT